MHNPTRRLLWDNTPFSCVFCRVRYLGASSFLNASRLHTTSVADKLITASSSRLQRQQHSVGPKLRKAAGGGDRFHSSTRRTILASSRSRASSVRSEDQLLAVAPPSETLAELSGLKTRSIFYFPTTGSISAATRIYSLWASQRRFLSSTPTLRNEYATSQPLETLSPSTSAQPSSSAPAISDLQAMPRLEQMEEENPRDLFWALFPKADPPEELERLATLRVQRYSRSNRTEDLLKKSLYLRKPITEWWNQYDDLSRRWSAYKDPVKQLEISSIGGADFVQMIESLKQYTGAGEATQDYRSDRMHRLERILSDTHGFLSIDSTETYRELIRTLRFWKEQDQLPAWVDRLRNGIASSPLYPNQTARISRYHQLMNALANENELGLLQGCFRSIGKDLGLEQPTVDTYNTLIQGYLMGRDTHRATETFQEMVDKGLQPTRSTFNILIRGYLANRDFLSSQRALESLLLSDIRPDIDTFNNLIAGYFNAGQYEIGYGFYKGLSEYGVMPNATTYYYLMKSYQQRRETNKVVELFLQMKQSDNASMHPNARVYRLLVQALAQDGRVHDALKVLQEMRSNQDITETAPIYSVMLNHYAKRRDGVRARRVLDWILQRRLVPSQGCFNPLIQLYLETGEYELAKEMTTNMMEHGVAPSTVTYNLLIKSTKPHGGQKDIQGGGGGLQAALNLYREMIRQGLEPDVWTYNILLDLMVNQLTPPSATRGSSRKTGSAGGDPTTNAVTHRQAQKYVPLMEELLRTMKAAKIRPDHATYGTLIHHYVLLGNVEAAEVLFHDMIKIHGVSPNPHICNTLLNGFVMNGEMDKALELFRRMPKKYGVEPTSATLTTLIKGYCHRHDLVAAQQFAQLLQEDPRLELDQHSFHMLMHLAQKSQQPGLALDFLEMMRARGIEPDKITYTTLINALSKRQELAAASLQQQRQEHQRQQRLQHQQLPPQYARRMEEAVHQENVQAVETFLNTVQQEKYPIHHTEITTILSAYFRLGRPRAAIEFFKASVRKADPKVSTSNCGALFLGLLRPEFSRRYDGAVLNLYSRMLTVTRARLKHELSHSQEGNDGGNGASKSSSSSLLPSSASSLDAQTAAMDPVNTGISDEQHRQIELASQRAHARLRGVPFSVIRDLMVSRTTEAGSTASNSSSSTPLSMAEAGIRSQESDDSALHSEWSDNNRSPGGNNQDLAQVLEQITGRFGSRYYEEQVHAKEQEAAAAAASSSERCETASFSSPSPFLSKSTAVPSATATATPPLPVRASAHSVEDNDALPNLDLITMQILFRAFTNRQDWSIVMQLWRDLNSLPSEQLYPHEIPLDVVAMASQAFFRMATKIQAADQHRRQVEPTFSQWSAAASASPSSSSSSLPLEDDEDEDDVHGCHGHDNKDSRQQQQRAEQAQEYLTMSEQLLRQVWLQNAMRGYEWSMKIHGRDIFGTGFSYSSRKTKQQQHPSRRAPTGKGRVAFGRRKVNSNESKEGEAHSQK